MQTVVRATIAQFGRRHDPKTKRQEGSDARERCDMRRRRHSDDGQCRREPQDTVSGCTHRSPSLLILCSHMVHPDHRSDDRKDASALSLATVS